MKQWYVELFRNYADRYENEPYTKGTKGEVDFIEKVGESIASTISSVKINIKTAYLLEQSQIQAEAMKAQEEEMRQNLEELTATQEEMAKKNRDIQGIIYAIDATVATFEIDMNGKILTANKLLLDLFDATLTEIKNIRLADLLTKDFLNSNQYKNVYKRQLMVSIKY